jgi:SAM-dependent methyltransferase
VERIEYERMHAVEDRMWWYRGLRALVVQEMARAAGSGGGLLLDAGCGTGGMLARLAPSAIGIEYDPLAAALACRKAGRPVACGSVNEMPLAAGVLAGYVSLDVLCHDGVDPERAAREAHRCLKPGAVALFNLPAYGWLLSAHDRRVHNVRRFTRSQARALFARCGFEILKASYWNTLLFPLMLLHRLTESADAASDVRDFPRWLDAVFSGALALERTAIGAGLSLPFGGSLMIVARRNG